MLNNRLRQLREEHDFSQEEIAQILGKSQKTISSWEKGRTVPKMKDLNQLCTLYDCTYEYLTGIKQHNANDVTKEDVLYKIASYNLNELEELKNHIDILIHNENQKIQIEMKRRALEQELRQLMAYKEDLENKYKTAPMIGEGGSGNG